MKVIQINTKSKSPKIDLNNINRIINNKVKNSSKNAKITKTRNNDYSSNKTKNNNIFKKLFSHNNCLHFSSNNCTSTNTTNFNNSKTNNFIILENDFNFKDSENLKQQIKSLIKHHSLNNLSNFKSNFSNIKFINNNNRGEKEIKKKKNIFNNILNKNIRENNIIDIFPLNKNEKLHFNTNYSVLLNNTKKENSIKYCAKIKNFKNCFNIYNSRPLTLNFSNEFNKFNSYKMLLNNNKSMKYLNKHKPNYRKKISPKGSLSKSKKKGKSEEKDSKRKLLLIDNKKPKESKSFNIMFTQKNDKLYYSTSFSPIHKINPKKKETRKNIKNNIRQLNNNNNNNRISMRINNNSIDRVQINLYNKKNNSNINSKTSEKKNVSVKTSENQINIKYFNKIDSKGKNNKNINKNINKKKEVIISQKTSPLYSKKLYKKIKMNNIKNKSKIQYNIVVDYDTCDKNKTFQKLNNKKNGEEKTIITPEQNHFLAVEQIQQIKKNNNVFG